MYKYDEVFDICKKYFNGDELATTVLINKYLLRDKDGLYHLNIYASVFSHTALASILREVAVLIKRGLETINAPRVVCKYIWFANYHNDLVRGIIDSEAAIPSLKEIKENQASMLIEIPNIS